MNESKRTGTASNTFQLAGDLMSAIALLPEDYYVQIGKESTVDDDSDTDERRWIRTAVVFQVPPLVDGDVALNLRNWPSRGACFGHPPGSASHREPCPRDLLARDAARLGVSAEMDEPHVLERLLIRALREKFSTRVDTPEPTP